MRCGAVRCGVVRSGASELDAARRPLHGMADADADAAHGQRWIAVVARAWRPSAERRIKANVQISECRGGRCGLALPS